MPRNNITITGQLINNKHIIKATKDHKRCLPCGDIINPTTGKHKCTPKAFEDLPKNQSHFICHAPLNAKQNDGKTCCNKLLQDNAFNQLCHYYLQHPGILQKTSQDYTIGLGKKVIDEVLSSEEGKALINYLALGNSDKSFEVIKKEAKSLLETEPHNALKIMCIPPECVPKTEFQKALFDEACCELSTLYKYICMSCEDKILVAGTANAHDKQGHEIKKMTADEITSIQMCNATEVTNTNARIRCARVVQSMSSLWLHVMMKHPRILIKVFNQAKLSEEDVVLLTQSDQGRKLIKFACRNQEPANTSEGLELLEYALTKDYQDASRFILSEDTVSEQSGLEVNLHNRFRYGAKKCEDHDHVLLNPKQERKHAQRCASDVIIESSDIGRCASKGFKNKFCTEAVTKGFAAQWDHYVEMHPIQSIRILEKSEISDETIEKILSSTRAGSYFKDYVKQKNPSLDLDQLNQEAKALFKSLHSRKQYKEIYLMMQPTHVSGRWEQGGWFENIERRFGDVPEHIGYVRKSDKRAVFPQHIGDTLGTIQITDEMKKNLSVCGMNAACNTLFEKDNFLEKLKHVLFHHHHQWMNHSEPTAAEIKFLSENGIISEILDKMQHSVSNDQKNHLYQFLKSFGGFRNVKAREEAAQALLQLVQGQDDHVMYEVSSDSDALSDISERRGAQIERDYHEQVASNRASSYQANEDMHIPDDDGDIEMHGESFSQFRTRQSSVASSTGHTHNDKLADILHGIVSDTDTETEYEEIFDVEEFNAKFENLAISDSDISQISRTRRSSTASSSDLSEPDLEMRMQLDDAPQLSVPSTSEVLSGVRRSGRGAAQKVQERIRKALADDSSDEEHYSSEEEFSDSDEEISKKSKGKKPQKKSFQIEDSVNKTGVFKPSDTANSARERILSNVTQSDLIEDDGNVKLPKGMGLLRLDEDIVRVGGGSRKTIGTTHIKGEAIPFSRTDGLMQRERDYPYAHLVNDAPAYDLTVQSHKPTKYKSQRQEAKQLDIYLTYLELFAGCGGSAIGAYLAGFNPLLLIDMNKDAIQSLKNTGFHRAEITNQNTNAQKTIEVAQQQNVHHFAKKVPDYVKGNVTLMHFGFSCKAVSQANQTSTKKAQFEETKNTIFSTIEAMKKIKPCFATFENSALLRNLKEADGTYTLDLLKDIFSEAGYELITSDVFNYSDFEVPQNRIRMRGLLVRRDIYEEMVEHNISFDVPEPAPKKVPASVVYERHPHIYNDASKSEEEKEEFAQSKDRETMTEQEISLAKEVKPGQSLADILEVKTDFYKKIGIDWEYPHEHPSLYLAEAKAVASGNSSSIRTLIHRPYINRPANANTCGLQRRGLAFDPFTNAPLGLNTASGMQTLKNFSYLHGSDASKRMQIGNSDSTDFCMQYNFRIVSLIKKLIENGSEQFDHFSPVDYLMTPDLAKDASYGSMKKLVANHIDALE